MRRDALPTPALVLDLDALERNIATMVAHAQSTRVGLRCHAKSHKCVAIARLLQRAGALGPACATIAEAEAMDDGGIRGILVTSPMVTPDQVSRVRRLLQRGADLMLVVDDPRNLAALRDVAEATGRPLSLVVELDVGVGRTGVRTIADGVAVAKAIAAAPVLRFSGIQAYWGHLQQVMPLAERRRRAAEQKERTSALIDALRDAGLPPAIVTGAGTGTSWVDTEDGPFTEIQPGSFLFLDSCYGAVPIADDGNPFVPSLFVAASVVTSLDPGKVIVNAGFKAFATDSGKPEPRRGAPRGATCRFMGDEHGAVEFAGGIELSPGHTIEFLTSHCDPTVNLYRAYHVVRGDEVVDTWPVAARGY